MDDALVGCLLLFLVSLVWLIGHYTRTKRGHDRRMQQLKGLFYALLSKQESLHQKMAISNEFQEKHKSDMRKLGEDIVALQRRIFELLTSK